MHFEYAPLTYPPSYRRRFNLDSGFGHLERILNLPARLLSRSLNFSSRDNYLLPLRI